jgi:hypothetical protein
MQPGGDSVEKLECLKSWIRSGITSTISTGIEEDAEATAEAILSANEVSVSVANITMVITNNLNKGCCNII